MNTQCTLVPQRLIAAVGSMRNRLYLAFEIHIKLNVTKILTSNFDPRLARMIPNFLSRRL
jgi:hypothetical protein